MQVRVFGLGCRLESCTYPKKFDLDSSPSQGAACEHGSETAPTEAHIAIDWYSRCEDCVLPSFNYLIFIPKQSLSCKFTSPLPKVIYDSILYGRVVLNYVLMYILIELHVLYVPFFGLFIKQML